jgi:hypothetical protein
MHKSVVVLFLFVASFFSFDRARADSEYIPNLPTDFDQVDMYLQTVGLGVELYQAFGHTLLRVIDRKAGTDVVFNWGVFDFRDPNFVVKFVYGDIDYRMAAYTMPSVLNIYRYEQRSLVQDKLNLTAKQKETLMRRIIWQSQPENLFFRYHYYFQNCATKVRDYVDEALGGKIRETLGLKRCDRRFAITLMIFQQLRSRLKF